MEEMCVLGVIMSDVDVVLRNGDKRSCSGGVGGY